MKHAGTIAALILAGALGWPLIAHGQGGPVLAPLPKECEAAGTSMVGDSTLPNVATALKERKQINILAIGSTAASLRGPVSRGYYAIIEQFLESTFKGLDVVVVHRGVSGELASDAAERIKTEAALNSIDLVLWQLGTADAMAQVPVEDFQSTVAQQVDWLKEHKIDVILVGLRYARSMAKDPQYQAIRMAIQDVAKDKNVLRLGRYEAEEVLEKVRREQGGATVNETEVTDPGYACMAEYLARAIASGLFLKDPTAK